ncbi:MAG TPA: hypothetical protein VIE67_09895 [Rudaea sp.]|jgi:hypothetical protein|uniref:hypothetical protein n=1 Tax=Rudaea sp. TaxID=2136325 RepID=UPI002F9250F4
MDHRGCGGLHGRIRRLVRRNQPRAIERGFPFNAPAYCGVVPASRYVLHETVSMRRWLGTLAITTGVFLVLWP